MGPPSLESTEDDDVEKGRGIATPRPSHFVSDPACITAFGDALSSVLKVSQFKASCTSQDMT